MLKVKGWKKIYDANVNQEEAWVSILRNKSNRKKQQNLNVNVSTNGTLKNYIVVQITFYFSKAGIKMALCL